MSQKIDFNSLLLGWEIETGYYSDPCDGCEQSPCDYCDVCVICDLLTSRRVISKHDCSSHTIVIDGKEYNCERFDFCELCHDDGLYDRLVEDMCSDCEDRYDDDYAEEEMSDRFSIDLEKFERVYYDRSCGYELPTNPYPILEFPKHIYPEWWKIKEEIGNEYGCGNHVNLSYPNSLSPKIVLVASIHYADLLSYMFLLKNTDSRNYTFRRLDFSTLQLSFNNSNEKYNYCHIKNRDSRIYEFRWVDACEFFNSTYLASIVCSFFLISPKIRPIYQEIFDTYKKHCYAEFEETPELEKKLKRFLIDYRVPIKEYSKILNIDMKSCLKDLFRKPMHMRDEDIPISFIFEGTCTSQSVISRLNLEISRYVSAAAPSIGMRMRYVMSVASTSLEKLLLETLNYTSTIELSIVNTSVKNVK